MACCSCKNLQTKNKKEGKTSGCKYFCSKVKSYVDGSNDSCPKYEKSYMRTTYEANKIYNEGRAFCDNSKNLGGYIILLIVLIVLAILVNL